MTLTAQAALIVYVHIASSEIYVLFFQMVWGNKLYSENTEVVFNSFHTVSFSKHKSDTCKELHRDGTSQVYSLITL